MTVGMRGGVRRSMSEELAIAISLLASRCRERERERERGMEEIF